MPNALSYYPSEKYIRKNWKPEQVPVETLTELANAERLARKNALLSKGLADKFLANALVEGRHKEGLGTFGVLGYEYPPNKVRNDALRKMGLIVEGDIKEPPDMPGKHLASDQELYDWEQEQKAKGYGWPDLYTREGTYTTDPYQMMDDPDYGRRVNAKLAAVILAEKARLYGEDKAIERWNGKGRAMEGDQQADASNHVRKVEEMVRMLNHPKNALLLQTYKRMMQGN